MPTDHRGSAPATAESVRDSRFAAGLFQCWDQSWTISTDDEATAAYLARLYAPMSTAHTDSNRVLPMALSPGSTPVRYELDVVREGRRGTLRSDGEHQGSWPRPTRLVGRLMWMINRQVIDRNADQLLLLHSGAASDAVGRVVLLPAPSESGKSTLTTGLLDRGLSYLTDEAAALDNDLNVNGYPKPLSIDPGSWDLLRHHEPQLPPKLAGYATEQWQVPPHEFTEVRDRGRLSLIVFPTYRRDAPTRLQAVDPITALDLARRSTFGTPGEQHPVARLRTLATLTSAVPCYTLESGDLATACDAVLDALARATP